jgi:4-azaleucine resistance transporter AzlC
MRRSLGDATVTERDRAAPIGSSSTGSSATGTAADAELRSARRALIIGALSFTASGIGVGIVYGLAARTAGLSVVEAFAMSLFVNAGAAQFAAVGLIAQGASWPTIVLFTALLNARHLLYSVTLAPWLTGRRRIERAAMAHVLTDETFGLSVAHFLRLGRADVWGYWVAASLDITPWSLATVVGVLGGQVIPDPVVLGLDVMFPAAMGGLAAGLITGRRELVAAVAGVAIALSAALASGVIWVGIVAGGVLAPAVGLAFPENPVDAA